jgi:AraC-like DNA-binding protein
MDNDTLTDLLRTVRLHGAAFDVLDDTSGGCTAPGGDALLLALVTRGEALATSDGDGGEAMALRTGDLVLMPRGTGRIALGAGATLVRGVLRHDVQAARLLIEAWPRLMRVPAARCSPWMTQLATEAARGCAGPRPGSEVVLVRLAEALLAETVRLFFRDQPAEGARGWLTALRDRYVARALAAMHDSPAHPWTVEELGNRVGLSRSALHDHFNQALGQPPNQYLARWRIELGSRLLRETRRPVASIAEDVGYESEAAFSRAFKRLVGQPPASWRRSQGARELVAG